MTAPPGRADGCLRPPRRPPSFVAMPLTDRQLRTFLEAVPVACLVVNASGNLVLANPPAEVLFGYSGGELHGRPVLELIPERVRERVPVPGTPIWPGTRGRLPLRGLPVIARRKDGSECPVEVDLTALDENGAPHGVVAMVHDVSRQQTDRERMLLHLSDVAHASRLSTMGEMVAGLAHELNQPLYAVANYARACQELVRDQPHVSERLASIAARLLEQTERAAEIVRRLRRFASRRMPQRTELDVNALVQDVEQLMLFHAHRFAITTELRLAPDLPRVIGDSILIEQVLVNLLRNAFEAVGEGKTSNGLVVAATSLDSRGQVQVTVRDNGPGFGDVPPTQLFEPFYTTKEQGMGMGLVISRSIAEAHGGRLTAHNLPGGGASFTLTLQTHRSDPYD